MFISHSLSIEESEFERNMRNAKSALEESIIGSGPNFGSKARVLSTKTEIYNAGLKFPFMDSDPEELTREDVRNLLSAYKQLVSRYSSLSEAVKRLFLDEDQLISSSSSRRDLNREMRK